MKIKIKTGNVQDEKCSFAVCFSDHKRGTIGKLATTADKAFTAKMRAVTLIPSPKGAGFPLLAVLVLRKYKLYPTQNQYRNAIGEVMRLVKERAVDRIAVDLTSGKAFEYFATIADAFLTAGYVFEDYRKMPDRTFEKLSVTIYVADAKAASAREVLKRAQILQSGVELARGLINHPPNVVNPELIASTLRDVAKKADMKCTVLNEKALARAGYIGLTAVGGGSANPPRMAIAHYPGRGPKKGRAKLVLVGKGISFDTGGISLKPWDGMWDMKGDMAGAAAVIGAFQAICELKPRAEVYALICTAENMPGGRAYRPGDILTFKNGKSVEIISTDAEGRLVLADGLIKACELGATHIVNIATLTGAVVVALGHDYTGLFGNDEDFMSSVESASARAGELMWRMPMPPWYKELLKSEYCDFKNGGGRWGGAITAAIFLREFVEEGCAWCHLDIAGSSMVGKPRRDILQAGGSGVGVRTLVQIAEDI